MTEELVLVFNPFTVIIVCLMIYFIFKRYFEYKTACALAKAHTVKERKRGELK